MSKTVSDKAKDGQLLTSMQSGVINVTSKVGNISSKAWSDINNLWVTGGGTMSQSNSMANVGGSKSDYNRISDNSSNENSLLNSPSKEQLSKKSSYTKLNDNNSNTGDNWGWDDSSWNNNSKSNNNNKKNNNLMDFDDNSTTNNDKWDDDDNWEPLEPVKQSKTKTASNKDK